MAKEVEEALLNGVVIEDYSDTEPLPSYLVLGYTKAKRPLHTVVGIDSAEQMIWAITVYEPNPGEWEEGFSLRRGGII
jgi:hypothetical protein